MKYILISVSVILLLTFSAAGQQPWNHGRLKAAENGNYLIHVDGTPSFWLGDTGWEMLARLNRSEIFQYLESRSKKGFNVIQTVLISEFIHIDNATNFYGDSIFINANPEKPLITKGSDPENALEFDYWDHVDYAVKSAEAKGLYMALVAPWGEWVVPRTDKPLFNTPEQAYNYGLSIGNRYRSSQNIIWILGGDRQPDGYNGVTVEEQITACAKNGGKAVCIQGMNVDEAIEKKDFEKLKRWIGMIRDYGLPAGLASHNPESIIAAEEHALPADFYHLTLGVPDTFESAERDKTLKTVSQIDKPMVVFKVFGAVRLEHEVALPYVMKAIRRKDGLCFGVDNPGQLIENARLVRELT